MLFNPFGPVIFLQPGPQVVTVISAHIGICSLSEVLEFMRGRIVNILRFSFSLKLDGARLVGQQAVRPLLRSPADIFMPLKLFVPFPVIRNAYRFLLAGVQCVVNWMRELMNRNAKIGWVLLDEYICILAEDDLLGDGRDVYLLPRNTPRFIVGPNA